MPSVADIYRGKWDPVKCNSRDLISNRVLKSLFSRSRATGVAGHPGPDSSRRLSTWKAAPFDARSLLTRVNASCDNHHVGTQRTNTLRARSTNGSIRIQGSIFRWYPSLEFFNEFVADGAWVRIDEHLVLLNSLSTNATLETVYDLFRTLGIRLESNRVSSNG